MQEKYMVNDVLAQVNSSLGNYATIITEAATPEFRKAVQDIRNSCEAFQYDLFKVAQSKGYYQPAAMADTAEIHKVWSAFSSPSAK
jgi:spore coat protein CotF